MLSEGSDPANPPNQNIQTKFIKKQVYTLSSAWRDEEVPISCAIHSFKVKLSHSSEVLS